MCVIMVTGWPAISPSFVDARPQTRNPTCLTEREVQTPLGSHHELASFVTRLLDERPRLRFQVSYLQGALSAKA